MTAEVMEAEAEEVLEIGAEREKTEECIRPCVISADGSVKCLLCLMAVNQYIVLIVLRKNKVTLARAEIVMEAEDSLVIEAADKVQT